MSKVKNLFVKLLLALASLCMVLGILELTLRIQDIYLSRRYGTDMGEEGELLRYDALFGWRNRENASLYFTSKLNRFKSLCTINTHGLRDDDYSYRKPPGTLRILLLGDSTIVGFEVPKKAVIDTVLEEILRKKTTCEVLNAGVRGYGTDQNYLFFVKEGFKYQPDIVLYVFCDNDPKENILIHRANRKYGKPYFILEKGRLVLKGVPVPQQFDPPDRTLVSYPSAEAFRNLMVPAARKGNPILLVLKENLRHSLLYYYFIVPQVRHIPVADRLLVRLKLVDPPLETELPEVVAYEWRITEALLQAMKSFCESKKIKFAVFEYTNGAGKPPAQNTPFKQIARKLDIPYIESLQPFFKESHGTKKFCHRADKHWNAKGHRLAAQIIANYLGSSGSSGDIILNSLRR